MNATIRFAVCLAVLLVASAVSAAAGFNYGWLEGYDAGYSRAQEQYKGYLPRGVPIDWSEQRIPEGVNLSTGPRE